MKKIVRHFKNVPIRIVIYEDNFYFAAYNVSEVLKFESPRAEVIHTNIGKKYKTALIDWEPNFKEFMVDVSFVIELTLRAESTLARQLLEWMIITVKELVKLSCEPPNGHLSQESKEQTFAITQIAKKYNMTGKMLNDFLHKQEVQFKVNDQWVLMQKYADKDYVITKAVPKRDDSGTNVLHTYWTEKGMAFIEELLKQHDISKADQLKLF